MNPETLEEIRKLVKIKIAAILFIKKKIGFSKFKRIVKENTDKTN